MNENQVATKFKVWSVFMYIFAGIDVLGVIFVVIAWIMGSNSRIMSFGMAGLSLVSNINVEAVWHGLMAGLTIGFILEVLINIHCGILLRRNIKRRKAPYIIYGIRNILSTISFCIYTIFICVNFSMMGLILLLPLAACAISAVMLFLRGLSDESPNMQQNYYSEEPMITGGSIEPIIPQSIPTQPINQPIPSITNQKSDEPVWIDTPAKPAQKPMGRVECTSGVALGQGFKLPEDKKVIVGKSPQKATLVINNQHISNVHCSIRYQAATNTYIVKDYSSNGTFVNGVRLQKEVPMSFPAGTVVSLADGTNQITLG